MRCTSWRTAGWSRQTRAPACGSDASMFIGQWLRSALKPECISAQTLRARARALASWGHKLLVRKFLGDVFGDRQRVPHREAVVHQHRHPPDGAHGLDGLLEGRVRVEGIEAHHDLLERDARLLEQHPGPHGPGRVVLVADIELEHAVSPEYLRMLPAPARLMQKNAELMRYGGMAAARHRRGHQRQDSARCTLRRRDADAPWPDAAPCQPRMVPSRWPRRKPTPATPWMTRLSLVPAAAAPARTAPPATSMWVRTRLLAVRAAQQAAESAAAAADDLVLQVGAMAAIRPRRHERQGSRVGLGPAASRGPTMPSRALSDCGCPLRMAA